MVQPLPIQRGAISAPPSVDRARRGLLLRLDLAAEAVRIVQADLGLRALARPQVGDMRLARDRCCEDRLLRHEIALDVVDDAGRRIAEQVQGAAVRIGEEGRQLRRGEIRLESVQRIAEVFPRSFPSPPCRRQGRAHRKRPRSGCRWGR